MFEAAGDDPLAQCLQSLRRQLPPGCQLLAVSKGQPAAAIRRAVAAGQRSFGESRLQEATAKQAALADLAPLDWHFIGRLQANKVRGVLRHFDTIHSLDSLALAQRLARIAAEEQARATASIWIDSSAFQLVPTLAIGSGFHRMLLWSDSSAGSRATRGSPISCRHSRACVTGSPRRAWW